MSLLQAIDRTAKWAGHNRQTESFQLGGRTVRPSFLEANDEHNHDISSLRWDPFEMSELEDAQGLKGQYEFYLASITNADGELVGALTIYDKQTQKRIYSGEIQESEKGLAFRPQSKVEDLSAETEQMLGRLVGQEISAVRDDLDTLEQRIMQNPEMDPNLGDPSVQGADPSVHGADPSVQGDDPSVHGADPSVQGDGPEEMQKQSFGDKVNEQMTVSPKGVGKAAKRIAKESKIDAVGLENAAINLAVGAGQGVKTAGQKVKQGGQNLANAGGDKIAEMRDNMQDKREIKQQDRQEKRVERQQDRQEKRVERQQVRDEKKAEKQKMRQEAQAEIDAAIERLKQPPGMEDHSALDSPAPADMDTHPVLNGKFEERPEVEKMAPTTRINQTHKGVSELGDPPVIEPIEKVFEPEPGGVYDWEQEGVFQEPEPGVYDWEKEGLGEDLSGH